MASIPLPATQIQTPQNPLEEAARAVSLRGMLQQQAGQQQEQQIRTQQMQDQQALTAAMKSWDPKTQDFNALAQAAGQNGASGQSQIGIQQHGLQLQQTAATIAKDQSDTGKNNQEAIKNKNDRIAGALQTASNVPDEQLAGHIPQAVEQLVNEGTLTNPQEISQYRQTAAQLAQMPPQAARDQLMMHEKGLQAQTVAFNQEQEKAKTTAGEWKEAGPGTLINTATGQKMQGTMPPDSAAFQSYMQSPAALQHGPYAAAMYPTWKAQQEAAATSPIKTQQEVNTARLKQPLELQLSQQRLLQQQSLLTPQALAMAGQNYGQTGSLPAGMRSPGMAAGILNNAASAPGGAPNIAANKANFEANTTSLKKLQTNADNVNAFEQTAGKNLDLFLQQAGKIVDTGSPWINKPLRSVALGALGSEDQAAANAARTTALTEIAKVLNSANASGVLSDSARGEVSGLVGNDASLKQIVAAAKILKQDMANRHDSYNQQIEAIQGRIKGGGVSTQPGGEGGGSPAQSTPAADPFAAFGGKSR